MLNLALNGISCFKYSNDAFNYFWLPSNCKWNNSIGSLEIVLNTVMTHPVTLSYWHTNMNTKKKADDFQIYFKFPLCRKYCYLLYLKKSHLKYTSWNTLVVHSCLVRSTLRTVRLKKCHRNRRQKRSVNCLIRSIFENNLTVNLQVPKNENLV